MAIKTYSYSCDGAKRLSAHFQVGEFASTAQSKIYSDTVLIDEQLVKILEDIFDKLSCSKIIITSGYRTPAHDIAVGGNGKGQHTLGKAADFVCYDKSGSKINAALVCCTAQDMNVWGIGYITASAVHIDTRPQSSKWWGDESTGNNGITDFYKYFKLEKTADYTQAVKQRFGFTDETMEFLQGYKYGRDLLYKLATRI